MPWRSNAEATLNASRRIAQNDRNHRRVVAVAGVQSAVAGQLQEQPRAIAQPRHAIRFFAASSRRAAKAAAALAGESAVAKTNAGVVYFRY